MYLQQAPLAASFARIFQPFLGLGLLLLRPPRS
jgi:hypothetical protein